MLNPVAGPEGKYAATSDSTFFCLALPNDLTICFFSLLSYQHGFDVCSPFFLFLLLENSFFGLLFFSCSLLSLILIFSPLSICTGARTTVLGKVGGGIREVWIGKRGREGIRVSRS